MQFSSFIFILLFLPATILLYFAANKLSDLCGKIVLIAASIIFYTYSDASQAAVLGISLAINFGFALIIRKIKKAQIIFIVPVVINVGLLIYFKYTNFFIGFANQYIGIEKIGGGVRALAQPLGISFFTFQQIAYIVAVYREEITNISIIDYLTYILFFPKLLMGPLADPVDFIKQINNKNIKKINADNLASGIKIFSFGLFKKAMLADVFANAVAWGFSNVGKATAMDLILATLFYTFEIYFDFSGYSDMAVGASQMLNITLPINFDSPYKALSIRDFWKRWHISLTKFFTKYIYIPLGGDKRGIAITCINTMIVFLISGLWHGANYTFILWGLLHGTFVIIDRLYDKLEKKIFEPARWILTFSTINILWLLFRAESISQWKGMIKTIIKMQSTAISDELINCFELPEMPFLLHILHLGRAEGIRGFWMLVYVIAALGICIIPDNNYKNRNILSLGTMLLAAVAFVWGLICLSSESVFVYFNF